MSIAFEPVQSKTLADVLLAIGLNTKTAAGKLALAPAEQKDRALRAAECASRWRLAQLSLEWPGLCIQLVLGGNLDRFLHNESPANSATPRVRR